MRKMQKQQVMDFIKLLGQAHDELKKNIEKKDVQAAGNLLMDCQDGAIELGSLIEQTEGEGCVAIAILQDYCEEVYQIYEKLEQGESVDSLKSHKILRQLMVKFENSVRNDIPTRIEAVFLPYKAAMWDSLESVWKAADADPLCDAYVVPIPYFDRNPDGSAKEMHYEGDLYPDYVPITPYQSYDIAKRCPDMIFIHNPYDDFNYVTAVHPNYFSRNLKQYTDCLVYIPYFSTSGGMSEGQRSCPAYYYADHIVIQAEKFRSYYDPDLPQDKFLPFGSPKFDRVIDICNDPPKAPVSWAEKMAGKKVYFYNTSINGMLANTDVFLKKMEYVFGCFEGRKDACLLWRPHPLLESTFESMRKGYKEKFEELKKLFFEKDLGIYDDTPNMTGTIALSDAYIGDLGTSVTSLFGIVGKPLFILDNRIHTEPKEGDWLGKVFTGLPVTGNDDFVVTSGNQLYYAPGHDHQYEYYCDLSHFSNGQYYSQVITIDGKNYVCPTNADHILVVEDKEIVRTIELSVPMDKSGAFYGAIASGDYLFLIPNRYPAIVRYDTTKDRLTYFDENLDVIIAEVNGERRIGGFCEKDGYVYIGSPNSNSVLAIEAATGKETLLSTNAGNSCGCLIIQPDGNDLWLLPYTGNIVTRWNPETGEVQEYDCTLPGLQCIHPVSGRQCQDKPFSSAAFYEDDVYLAPRFGNLYVKLNKISGEVSEWQPLFEQPESPLNGYFAAWFKGLFLHPVDEGKLWRLYSAYDRKVYDVNLVSNEFHEIEIAFDAKQVKEHEPGFQEYCDWLMYVCEESAWNSLSDFLDGNITGNQFDKKRQQEAFGKIAANYDGTCGKKVYDFLRDKAAN
ncbi:MAG: hypothetical protein J1E61_07560 [Lachnospiraceae bacterium]|nr:hypothetical protein [Lachnospiraceae bacterium]